MRCEQKILLGFFLLFCLGLVTAPLSVAQSTQPLTFGNNFFVTGDYVIAGAYNMNQIQNGYAQGTINIPDGNPGIQGVKQVPAGAEVVDAILYWQTVENAGVTPGQPGSGQNGFFRPLFTGGPAKGYPITGVSVGADNATTWSYGGCTSVQSSKLTRLYRANVLAALPQDSKGNTLANGKYEVRLPSSNPNTPLTLGATLVIIYRVLSPSVPLNSIVIYEGAFGQSTSSLKMTQSMQGFYDAKHTGGTARLTHIVAAGQPYKYETAYLDSVSLPSLYPGSSTFPGYYGSWDNPTWTLSGNANPLKDHDATATTQVVPSANNSGCVNWGATIFSTTVFNSDGDGLLDAWKKATPPGYCDASINEGVCQAGNPADPAWVSLPGATPGRKDIFVQLDYMCSTVTGADSCNATNGVDYTFDPRQAPSPTPIDLVTQAFAAKGIALHVNPAGTGHDIHAIPEPSCTDIPGTPPQLCPFPNQPGVIAWKGGVDYLKTQQLDPDDLLNPNSDCATSPYAKDCVQRFQHGRKDSWHYVLFAHAVGEPEWRIGDGSLTKVAQSGNTVTFTTSGPVGALTYAGRDIHGNQLQDPSCPNGRVTVLYAVTNSNLNGTFCINSATTPQSTSFSITVPGNPTTATYTLGTDPYLSIAPGQAGTGSGVSDVGGGDSLITLGLWGDPTLLTSDGQQFATKTGTFMHELGHSLGLTHGGFYFDTANSYAPTIEANCKPNHLSVMNYMFQVDLLDNGSGTNVPDYSEETLPTLNESTAQSTPPFSSSFYKSTSWYALTSVVGGNPAAQHCDGSPLLASDPLMVRITHPINSFTWTAGQQLNFDGKVETQLRGYNDWAPTANTSGIDLRQIGATGSLSVDNGKQFNGGGLQFNGGGKQFNGGGKQFNGGGQQFNGGGKQFNGGGKQFNGGGEIDEKLANSVTRSPRNLTGNEGTSPRAITLNWNAPTFGQIGSYNIYRNPDKNGNPSFGLLNSVSGSTFAYTDTVTCLPTAAGYQYYVTAVLGPTSPNPGQESAPSNTVNPPAASQPPLTGCYALNGGSNALSVAGFASPAAGASFTQGDLIPIAIPATDDYYPTGGTIPVTASKTVVAIGPLANDGACPSLSAVPQFLNYPGGPGAYPQPVTVLSMGGSGLSNIGNQLKLNWDTTLFNAGCYVFEADFDSGQVNRTEVQLTIFASDSTPHILTTTLPNATAAIPFTNTLQASGGFGQLTWTLAGGSSLPTGLTLSPGGTVSGTPTAAGNYTFTAKVTDTRGNFGTRTFTMTVRIFVSDVAPLPTAPYVTSTIPTATAGIPFSNTLYETGAAAGALSWSVTGSGVLPPGLSLNPTTGLISGTPTTAGNYNFTVQVTDSSSNTGSLAFSSKVQIFVSDSAAPTINTTLPSGTIGLPYAPNQIQTTGGTGSLTWIITSGGLPTGVTLNSVTGVVSGTPMGNAGPYTFTVQVTDTAGNTGNQTFNLPINIFVSDSMPPPYTVTPTLPTATAGIPFSNTLQQAGAVGAVTWSIIGSLPPGLSLDPGTGTISGTPTTAGNYSFTVQVTDSASNTITQTFSMSVAIFLSNTAAPTVTTALPTVTAGSAYTDTIQEVGAVGTVAWTFGTLPPGLTSGPGGTISGTPTTAGNYSIHVQITDGSGNTASQTFTLTVSVFVSDSPIPTVTTALPAGTVGSSYTNTVDEGGGTAPFTWTLASGALPVGLTLNSSTGVISGIPAAPGNYNFTVQVTDSLQNTGTQSLSLAVLAAQYGDLIVVDGSPAASPLGGSLLRVSPTGTAGQIAAITNGSPTSVAVDSNTGTSYILVSAVGAAGTSRIVKVDRYGAVTDPFISTVPVAGAVLQNPGAIAVDASGNVYVEDNTLNAVYEFSPSGTQVGTGAFATFPLPSGASTRARMAFDPTGNLDVARDDFGGSPGQVQIEQLAPNGTITTLYNSFLNATGTYAVTVAGPPDSSGNVTYTGTFSPVPVVGSLVTFSGFAAPANNAGPFPILSASATQIVVNNPSAMANDPNTGTATVNLLTIQSVGGITPLADGSIDVADYTTQTIYNIGQPGAANPAVTVAISATTATTAPASPLGFSISGMANPPSASNTNLFVTLTGVNSTTPQVQLAVPQTGSIGNVSPTLTFTLTAAGSVDSSGNTTYTGTFSPVIPAGASVTIAGFATPANNGTFTVVSCTATQLVVSNAGGVADSSGGTAAFAPLTYPNDISWYSKQ